LHGLLLRWVEEHRLRLTALLGLLRLDGIGDDCHDRQDREHEEELHGAAFTSFGYGVGWVFWSWLLLLERRKLMSCGGCAIHLNTLT
jgi:hypothetical protein